MIVVGVDASPFGPGKTSTIVAAVLDGAAARGAVTWLIRHDAPDVLERIAEADAVVFGSPTYRGGHTAALRALLEKIDRKEGNEPLAATPVAIVMTGASQAHFLGTRELATVLSGFFGTQVLSPDLYVGAHDFDSAGVPREDVQLVANLHGQALVELAAAVENSTALKILRPLV